MISIEGQNLKNIRERKNIGITELSRKAKVGIATISELESGTRQRPTSATLMKLANALNVNVNDILGIEENTEYDITDMEKMFTFILDANGMEIDGIELDNDENKELETMLKATIALIRQRRFDKK